MPCAHPGAILGLIPYSCGSLLCSPPLYLGASIQFWLDCEMRLTHPSPEPPVPRPHPKPGQNQFEPAKTGVLPHVRVRCGCAHGCCVSCARSVCGVCVCICVYLSRLRSRLRSFLRYGVSLAFVPAFVPASSFGHACLGVVCLCPLTCLCVRMFGSALGCLSTLVVSLTWPLPLPLPWHVL